MGTQIESHPFLGIRNLLLKTAAYNRSAIEEKWDRLLNLKRQQPAKSGRSAWHSIWLVDRRKLGSCVRRKSRATLRYIAMLIPHPLFPAATPDTVIWRYLELWKFESLINSAALYFRRADLLTQIDRKEGALTRRMEEFFDQALFNSRFVMNLKRQGVTRFGLRTQITGRPTLAIRDELRQRARAHYRFVLQRTFINCWHINPEENYLMWRQYVPSGSGVAIRSTVGRLTDAMSATSSDVYAVPVDYVDHANEPIRPERLPGGMSQIVFDMLSKKRKGFSGESEFRLVTDTLTHEEKWAPNLVGSHLDTSIPTEAEETQIEASLDAMIESVVLFPGSTNQLRLAVEELVRDQPFAGRLARSALD